MLVLGLLGSPRKKGNTAYLLDRFLAEMESRGAAVHRVDVAEKNIRPCRGCIHCEKKGFCAQQDDDMSREMYGLLRRAEVVAAASPMYFYSAPAQLKALIDRTQTLWSRRYKLKLTDPQGATRAGIMLCVGATRGQRLFDGMRLTSKYFFDAIAAEFSGELGYRRVEHPGDLKQVASVTDDVKNLAAGLDHLFHREKILFLCRENACRSKMAAAFARQQAGDRVEALSAGSRPAQESNPEMEKAMAEIGLDMFLRTPRAIDEALAEMNPDKIVTMGCRENCPFIPGAEVIEWDIPDPAGQDPAVMREVRDTIKNKVAALLG